MKIQFVIICALLSNCFLCAEENQSLSFYMTPSAKYSQGKIEEIFYHKYSSCKVSLLEWDRNIFLYGFEAGGNYKHMDFNVNFYTSVTDQVCGQMRDSDWLVAEKPEMKTTYSIGNVYNCANYESLFETGWKIKVKDSISFRPFIQVQYKFDSFMRKKNAEGWYGDYQGIYDADGRLVKVIKRSTPVAWNDSEALKFPYRRYDENTGRYMKGVIEEVDYVFHRVNVYGGAEIILESDKLSFGLRGLVSVFNYYSGEDCHHTLTTPDVYHLIQQGSFAEFKSGFEILYKVTERVVLAAAVESTIGIVSKGDLYSGWSKSNTQKSGTEINEFMFKTGIRFLIK